jgi:hypothetical protein
LLTSSHRLLAKLLVKVMMSYWDSTGACSLLGEVACVHDGCLSQARQLGTRAFTLQLSVPGSDPSPALSIQSPRTPSTEALHNACACRPHACARCPLPGAATALAWDDNSMCRMLMPGMSLVDAALPPPEPPWPSQGCNACV